MLSLSKLNKRSKSALGSCKISWQLLFIFTHSIRVSVAVTSWGPKFRPFGWFPNSHRSSSLECLDHSSSPWAQKMEASFDTHLARQYFTQTRFSKGSTGFSWNLNDKYKDMQMIFNTLLKSREESSLRQRHYANSLTGQAHTPWWIWKRLDLHSRGFAFQLSSSWDPAIQTSSLLDVCRLQFFQAGHLGEAKKGKT